MFKSNSSKLDRAFYVSLLLKATDSLLEIVGGVLLLLISPNNIHRFISAITQHELTEDPRDFIANRILKVDSDFASSGSRYFAAFYLLSHGLVKIVIIAAIFKQKLWAYPVLMVTLGIFVVYQVYRLSYHFSIGLALLTLFDLLIIWLTWREYHKQKAGVVTT